MAGALNVSTVTRRGRDSGSFVRAPVDASVERLRTELRDTGVHELREIGDHHLAVSATAASRLAAARAADHCRRLRGLTEEWPRRRARVSEDERTAGSP